MKIQKLLEDLVNADIKRKNFNGTLKGKDTDYATSKKQLSNGSQASVKADPNDPHMIKKHNTKIFPEKSRVLNRTRENDGFNDYIEYLINNNLTDNIHFPKIYNIKTITDKTDHKIHSYTIEKLIETEALSEPELDAFIENNLSEAWQGHLNWAVEPFRKFIEILSDCIEGKRSASNILSNKELIDAVNILHQAKNELKLENDLSVYNVMWRRTPYGMVLVFTDPFF